MRHRIPVALAAVVGLLATPGAAAADYRFDGRGWGHGIGLSQWGAAGYARAEGRDASWIVRHYYAGTRVGKAPRARMRVRLRRAGRLELSGAHTLRAPSGRRVALRPGRAYRITTRGATGVTVRDVQADRVVARMQAPVRATGRVGIRLAGRAENDVRGGRYRGAMRVLRDGDALLAVNDVDLEHYLYGVVPGEMPPMWAAAALQAQAIVARSYALTSRSPSAAWDVYADTRSQVYRGIGIESASTTRAVQRTRARVVLAGGAVARTYFFSTSGGRTAAIEEVWGGLPVGYLRSVADPHDDASPYHRWTERLTDEDVEKRLGSEVLGDLESVAVVARTPSGRAGTVRVTGTKGVRDLTADRARGLLELRSTWFSITRERPREGARGRG